MLDSAPIRRIPGDYERKWIGDDYLDLIVWYASPGAIYGFQLCYDKPQWERALTWMVGRGFSHMEVDDGEQNAYANQTPILVPDGSFPAEEVIREFQLRAAELPLELKELVLRKIAEYMATRKL
jgi:hypothetical protein